jgi:hypothetical protein
MTVPPLIFLQRSEDSQVRWHCQKLHFLRTWATELKSLLNSKLASIWIVDITCVACRKFPAACMYWLVAEKRLYYYYCYYLVRFIFRGSDILRSCSRHEIQNSTGYLNRWRHCSLPFSSTRGREGLGPWYNGSLIWCPYSTWFHLEHSWNVTRFNTRANLTVPPLRAYGSRTQ